MIFKPADFFLINFFKNILSGSNSLNLDQDLRIWDQTVCSRRQKLALAKLSGWVGGWVGGWERGVRDQTRGPLGTKQFWFIHFGGYQEFIGDLSVDSSCYS